MVGNSAGHSARKYLSKSPSTEQLGFFRVGMFEKQVPQVVSPEIAPCGANYQLSTQLSCHHLPRRMEHIGGPNGVTARYPRFERTTCCKSRLSRSDELRCRDCRTIRSVSLGGYLFVEGKRKQKVTVATLQGCAKLPSSRVDGYLLAMRSVQRVIIEYFNSIARRARTYFEGRRVDIDKRT